MISKISNNKEPLGISISKNQEGALILPISFMMGRILKAMLTIKRLNSSKYLNRPFKMANSSFLTAF